jgi:Tol biopolymer transport system component
MVWSHFTDDFSAAQIVRGDADTKHVHALTHFADGRYDLEAGLSPNHKQVVFQRSFPDDTAGIGYVDTAGKHEHILNLHCTDPCVEDDDPTWSRDDEHIVFTRVFGPFDPNHNNNAASAVLWTSDLSGQHLRRLSEPGIDGKFEDYRAQFGPGGWATFIRVRNSDGKTAIFAMKAAGGHAHQLTPGTSRRAARTCRLRRMVRALAW